MRDAPTKESIAYLVLNPDGLVVDDSLDLESARLRAVSLLSVEPVVAYLKINALTTYDYASGPPCFRMRIFLVYRDGDIQEI